MGRKLVQHWVQGRPICALGRGSRLALPEVPQRGFGRAVGDILCEHVGSKVHLVKNMEIENCPKPTVGVKIGTRTIKTLFGTGRGKNMKHDGISR
jgi:hypothetical protein